MEREDKKIVIISLKTITVSFQFFAKKKWQLLFYAIPRTDKGVVIIIFVSSQVDR